MHRHLQSVACLALASGVLLACGSDDSPSASGGPSGGDKQTPPQTGDQVEAWLADGAYLAWSCEEAVHASRAPSPHGFNRICSNAQIADRTADNDAWPEGAAAVKELYADASGGDPIGYAVYLKTSADSAGGANWYWYERIGSTIYADGLGDSGGAKKICVTCHAAAGADAAHTPSEGGRDQVYTPVPTH